MSASNWTYLVRFTHQGHPTFAHLTDLHYNGDLADVVEVDVCTGDPVFGTIEKTGEIVKVNKVDLLAPFATVPIVINTGLNYSDHVSESVPMSYPDLFPPLPYIFYRPSTSLAAPYAPKGSIKVYKAQQECLDYECEMVFQTGSKPLKDITVEEAKKHIIGITAGNDFSPRPGKVLGRMNFIFSKGFDNWTPVGPVLVAPSVVGMPPQLNISTKLDGKVVQSSNTKHMIFDAPTILASMSTGTTVQPGTVVFSGTCGGGQWFIDEGKTGGIRSGAEVEVELEKVGKIVSYPVYIDK